jgi:hypothetical protein
MELEELKQIWALHNNTLNDSLKCNVELLKLVCVNKYKSALQKAYFLDILNIVIQLLMIVCVITFFLLQLIDEIQFCIPGIIAVFLGILSIILSGITARRMARLSIYNANILDYQKELLHLKILILRIRKASYFIAPLLCLMIFPVFLKGFANIDIYHNLRQALLPFCISLVGGVLLGTWLNISTYDKGVSDAEMYLKELEQFEKEE